MGRLRGTVPPRRSHPRARSALASSLAIGLLLTVGVPLAAAHPLGNFTINHYAGVRIEPDRVLLDIVVDQAEIPTFTARTALDLDGDGQVSDAETASGRVSSCEALVPDLHLRADDAALALHLTAAGLRFPPGAAGLSTMRVVCEFEAPLATPLTAQPRRIAFSDSAFAERIGWREIVASASGATIQVVDGVARDGSPSARLTAYPQAMIAQPLADRSITIDATIGGATSAVPAVSDAEPLGPVASPLPVQGSASPAAPVGSAAAGPSPTAGAGAVIPGGVAGGDLPSIFRQADLTPVVLLLSVLSAIALGAGHALTPGHGKTLMAAYLVGTRGRPMHALGLGLSVSLSHTVGILVLAALIVGAADILPADLVVRTVPVIAAISIVAIGGWMLFGEWRRRRALRLAGRADEHDHGHGPEDDHEHDHPHDHEHGQAAAHDHDHDHDHGHEHAAAEHATADGDAGLHSHGGRTHSHLPAAGQALTWRSLFVLGLAGGLIPSTSALLILLGSMAAGRPAFGFLLVVAFGLGMAGVMSGIGLAMVLARGRLDRMPSGGRLAQFRDAVPVVAGIVVLGFGLYLTAQAISGSPTF